MVEKIEKSIKTLKLAAEMSLEYYGKPMILCYSGGKDSDVLLHLAKSCLKPTEFEVLNSHTSCDAPETVRHIRKVIAECRGEGITANIRYPEYKGEPMTMWKLIPKKHIPPTRLVRYCCEVLKETSTPNRMACLGVRAAEGSKRQGRDAFGVKGTKKNQYIFFSTDHADEVNHDAKDRDPVWDCTLIKTMREHGDVIVSPIYEWTDNEIWQYVKEENIEMNPLYERGYKRVGCIGCPMATRKQVEKEFNDYPKIRDAYIRAFQRMVDNIKREAEEQGVEYSGNWETGQDVFDWWTGRYKHNVKGQMTIEDYMSGGE